MNDFLKEETTPYFCRVRNFLIKEDYLNFIKYVQFSTKKLVELYKKGIISYLCTIKLPENIISSDNDIVSTAILVIFTELKNIGFDYLSGISEVDKLNACRNRNASVIISMFGSDEIIEKINVEDELSPIHQILIRDDPFLLDNCLTNGPHLFSAAHNLGLSILLFAVRHKSENLLDNFFMFVDYFQMTDEELTDAVSAWKLLNPKSPLPTILQLHYDACLNNESKDLYLSTETRQDPQPNVWFIESSSNNIYNMANEIKVLGEKLKNNKQCIIPNLLDGTENSLCDLPYFLMSTPEALVSRVVYLNEGPVGIGKGEGEGMFKTLLQKYFSYIEEKRVFVNADQGSSYFLPTNEIITDPKKLNEYRAIFYGLGVVYLKCLLSKIPFNFHIKPHIWVFKSMVSSTNFKKVRTTEEKSMLIKEAIQFDPICSRSIFECMYIDFQKEELYDQFIKNMIDINHRGEFIDLIGKGFRLEFDPTVLPFELKSKLEESRKILKYQLEAIRNTSAEAIRKCLVCETNITTKMILDMFKFRYYEDIQRYIDDENHVEKMLSKKDVKTMKAMDRTKQIIINCLTKWTEDPDKTMLETFLSLVVGVTNFTPYSFSKWEILITKNAGEVNKVTGEISDVRTLRVWACDNQVMVSIFDSEEQFTEKVIEFSKYNKVQHNYIIDGNK